jgi:amidase
MALLETAMSILDAGFHPAPLPTRARLAVLDVSAKTEVMATVRAALDDSGLSLTAAALPLGSAFDAALAIIGAETWAAFGSLTNRGTMGLDVRARLLAAREISREQVDAAEQVRLRFKAEVDLLLDDVDALALPTMPDFPLTLTAAADARAAISTTALVRPFNLSGHPAVTIPLLAPGGLPVGLQLIGRMGEDAALCALARHVSSAGRAVVRAQ